MIADSERLSGEKVGWFPNFHGLVPATFQFEEIDSLLGVGQKLEAIKKIRGWLGLRLKDAKEVIERRQLLMAPHCFASPKLRKIVVERQILRIRDAVKGLRYVLTMEEDGKAVDMLAALDKLEAAVK